MARFLRGLCSCFVYLWLAGGVALWQAGAASGLFVAGAGLAWLAGGVLFGTVLAWEWADE